MSRRHASKPACVAAGLAIVCCLAREARAEGASDKAAAEALFQEGRALVADKKFEEACKKFELSQELDAGVGTLLYLGDCYEQAGRIASAWATFKEAAAAARGAGQADREQFARAEADALEPKLSRLSVNVAAENAIEGFVLRRDGQTVPRGLWSVPVPVDTGTRHLEASAPGKKPWSIDFRVEGPGSSQVSVPALVDDPAAKAPAPAATPTAATEPAPSNPIANDHPASGGTQRMIGFVVGGVGVVGLGVGAVFGLRAKSKDTEAASHCGADGLCDAQGVDLGDQARSSASLATVLSIGGAVAIAGGVVLILTAPSGERSASGAHGLRFVAGPGTRGPEVRLTGTW